MYSIPLHFIFSFGGCESRYSVDPAWEVWGDSRHLCRWLRYVDIRCLKAHMLYIAQCTCGIFKAIFVWLLFVFCFNLFVWIGSGQELSEMVRMVRNTCMLVFLLHIQKEYIHCNAEILQRKASRLCVSIPCRNIRLVGSENTVKLI